jgi:hypothetical protein
MPHPGLPTLIYIVYTAGISQPPTPYVAAINTVSALKSPAHGTAAIAEAPLPLIILKVISEYPF